MIAQSKLQVVKCEVCFFIKTQKCETRLLSLQELVQGSRNGGKACVFFVVETYNPLLGKDFFQHSFLTWKYISDDGSRTIKLRVICGKTIHAIFFVGAHYYVVESPFCSTFTNCRFLLVIVFRA